MKQKSILIVLVLCMCTIGVDNINGQTKKPVKRTTTQVRKASSSTKQTPKNSREYKIENDGFEWYLVCKNEKYGAESRDGTILVPIEYSAITYLRRHPVEKDFGGFYVKKGKYVSWYNEYGKCVIPFTWQYIDIYKSTEDNFGTYFICKSNNNTYAIHGLDGDIVKTFNLEYSIKHIFPQWERNKLYYLIESEDSGFGIVDGNGKMVIVPSKKYGPIYVEENEIKTQIDGEYITIGSSSSISTTTNPLAKNPKEGEHKTTPTVSDTRNNSNNNNSGNITTTVVVEHHRDPVPVQDWVPCSVCGHNPGVCQTCVGNKTNYRGDPCISCRGTGKCHFCNGQGGRYQIVYR